MEQYWGLGSGAGGKQMENQQWEKPDWEAATQNPQIHGFISSFVQQDENLGWSSPNSQEGTQTLSQKLLVQIWDGKLEVEDSIGREQDEAELQVKCLWQKKHFNVIMTSIFSIYLKHHNPENIGRFWLRCFNQAAPL